MLANARLASLCRRHTLYTLMLSFINLHTMEGGGISQPPAGGAGLEARRKRDVVAQQQTQQQTAGRRGRMKRRFFQKARGRKLLCRWPTSLFSSLIRFLHPLPAPLPRPPARSLSSHLLLHSSVQRLHQHGSGARACVRERARRREEMGVCSVPSK